jgi:hypothetical protein
MTFSPEIRIIFSSKTLQNRFTERLPLCGVEKHKLLKSRPEIGISFGTHKDRLEFLFQLMELSGQNKQGIDFIRISTGSVSWVYIAAEEELPDLVLAAQDHYQKLSLASRSHVFH